MVLERVGRVSQPDRHLLEVRASSLSGRLGRPQEGTLRVLPRSRSDEMTYCRTNLQPVFKSHRAVLSRRMNALETSLDRPESNVE